MAIKIEFDSSHNVISPTFVLATRNGNKLGGLLYHNLVVKQSIHQSMEMSFSVNKNDYNESNHNVDLWKLITDFKLIWCKEWNCYFEINVTINEEFALDKEITAVSLGEAELSQINLYNIQINTEDDIARDDYEPTVLYNPDNVTASLLHRIMEKVPHYIIKYVDPVIKDVQRTFTFDNKTLYDVFQEIAEEIECVFDVICNDSINGIERYICIYALKNYGEDTNILLTTDALADNINYSVDTGAVKNCFKLEAGDDLMTATIRNCNPNGSDYIWYISDELKSDMSEELVNKLESYNDFYNYYQNTYNPFSQITNGLSGTDAAKVNHIIQNYATLVNQYNLLIDKYSLYSSNYQKIISPIVGYAKIMEAYYNTIDFYYYLNNSLMPTTQMSTTNAKKEANNLNTYTLRNTAVQNLSNSTSTATVSSAILAMARAIVDIRYQVKIIDESCNLVHSGQRYTWNGDVKVTNYSNEDDTYTITLRGIPISDNYAEFIQQKLNIALSNTRTDTSSDIKQIFNLTNNKFKLELKKYSLQRLKAFHDACQGCIDILIQQGIADSSNSESTMYKQIYLSYYNKLGYIQSEMNIRQRELEIIVGKFDANGGLLEDGMQSVLEKERNIIQSNLNFQNYLGTKLWQEFIAYRREDTYSNTNYVSDGLDNNKLFARATEFIQTAKDEIENSATKQHTINARLKNLIVMKEFSSIVDYFEVGNWLRLKVDGKLFKLRLVDYQIDFENLESINVTFSDIIVDGTESTAKKILNQAASMATSYNTVTRQARKGDKSSVVVDNLVNDGLSLTTTKIIDNADNQEVSWDRHGLICREYNNSSDSYNDTQVKLINKGIYVTDNNWKTAKVGIGNFTFFNPAANDGEGEYQEDYGVIANTIVGNIILGKNVGIYNTKNSLTMDEDGFVLTTNGTNDNETQSVFTIRRKTVNNGVKTFKNMFYVDNNGYVTINGGVKIDIDGESGNSTMIEMVDGKITSQITSALNSGGTINSEINQAVDNVEIKVASELYGTTNKKLNEARLNVQSGSIVSTVSQKLNTSDLGTQIIQNAESVRLAWNGVSKYMSFEYSNDSPSLNIYASSLSDNASSIEKNNKRLLKLDTSGLNIYTATDGTLQMKLNNNGSWFYNSNTAIGTIGTNVMGAGNSPLRGLTFDLDTMANFMAWGYKESGTNGYETRLIYYPNTVELPDAEYAHSGFFLEKGFHFYDDIYLDAGKILYLGNKYDNVTMEMGLAGLTLQNQYSATRIYGQGAGITLVGDIGLNPVSGGIVNCGSDLYMNNNVIYDTTIATSSDARLKTNIAESSIKALSLLNQIDIREFDWIKSQEHTNAGIIAQQLQKIIPELVQTNPTNGRLSIKSDNFIPYLIKAIQEIIVCLSNDNRYKNFLESFGVEFSKDKNDWHDNLTVKDKERFIVETEYNLPTGMADMSEKKREHDRKIREFLRRQI